MKTTKTHVRSKQPKKMAADRDPEHEEFFAGLAELVEDLSTGVSRKNAASILNTANRIRTHLAGAPS